MIFAVETEERTLIVFSSEDEAIASCEGLDVEAATRLFWTADGSPLEADFLTLNRRGWFSVENGTYRLVPASADHHAHLSEALEHVLQMEPNPFFPSLSRVQAHLAGRSTTQMDEADAD